MAKKKTLGIKPRPGPDPVPDAKGHSDKAEDLKLIKITVKPMALRAAPGKAAKAKGAPSAKANPFAPAAKSRTGSKKG